ncbi:cation channel sperm-associated protein subunit zeta [Ochotona curzoniae]|uniref:cation channel sperm-associated protein subunit zeta n=1 Tax=Ochotona curzoniae TaxID=130825 RepID=UPI001B35142A|nr:cation channel sperm-associated protein subunit zeta [Ochotona curzoniae]
MEENLFKVSPKSQERQSSQRSSEHDIRNLWTTATLSQTQLHLPLSYFCEKFDEDGGTVRTSAPGWLSPEELWREEEVSSPKGDRTRLESEPRDQHTLLDQQLHRGSSEEGHVEEDDEESNLSSDKSLTLSFTNVSKHPPHRAYWAEQQNRLPLPLMELMENEVLEILTKALQSYRTEIGRDHFLTKELKRYIEGLKRRRGKRLRATAY